MTGLLKNIIPFLLLGALVAGSVETFYRIVFPRFLRTEAPPPQEQTTSKNLATDNTAPVSSSKQPDIGIIVKRNLFQAKAKAQPAASQKPEPSQLNATALDLNLLGTITGPPNSRRAIIQNKKNKTQELYYQGDAVQGSIIKEIQRGKVILNVNGKDEILIPEIPKSASNNSPSAGNPSPDNPAVAPMPHEPSAVAAEMPPEVIPPENVIEPEPLVEREVVEPPQTPMPPESAAPQTSPVPPPSPANSNQKQVVP